MSNRTADEIRAGRVMSTQCMFHTALQHERDLKLNFWESQAPRIEGLGVSVAAPGSFDPGPSQRAIDWLGRLDGYAQSVDQRVKMAGWMETFAQRGGQLVIHGAAVGDLDYFSRTYDLVLVSMRQGRAGLHVRAGSGALPVHRATARPRGLLRPRPGPPPRAPGHRGRPLQPRPRGRRTVRHADAHHLRARRHPVLGGHTRRPARRLQRRQGPDAAPLPDPGTHGEVPALGVRARHQGRTHRRRLPRWPAGTRPPCAIR